MNRLVYTLFTFMLLLLLASCNQGSFPKSLSQLNDLEGIEVKKGVRCPDCCDIVFSEEYAYRNNEQLTFLLQMTKNNYIEKEDMNCPKPIMPLDYYVLDHLVYLATKKQDKAAAEVILSTQGSSLLDLDGELAEEFIGDRMLPVLERYKNLSGILTTNHSEMIATDLCNWKEFRGEGKRINRIIQKLEGSGLRDIANAIIKKCNNT